LFNLQKLEKMGKKIFSVVVLALAAYGLWQGALEIKAMIQKKKVASKPVVPVKPAGAPAV
jgi:hypothetical protein